ncbi:MAG TPA: hypothetical protein VN612_08665 [Acidobacteriaceae bacterium]|nr:hypothetical protein [Acidobacteriaceae bacterium]
MLEQPEFRSDHDPRIAGTTTEPAPPRAPVAKRVRAWTMIWLFVGAIVGMAAGGIYILRSSLHKPGGWDNLDIALGLLLPLGFLIWFALKTRIKTGKWTEDAKTRQATHARNKEKLALNRGRPWAPWRYALAWAGYTAFAPACGWWQRAAAWTVLAGEALVMLAVTAFGVIAIGASFDPSVTGVSKILVAGLGLLLFFLPGKAVIALVKRERAGQMRVSREDLDGLRAQRAAWRKREHEKPLRSKLMTTATILVSYGFLWVRTTLHHKQHPHENWMTPAIYTPLALYLIWVQFRRPKGTAADEAAPPAT